MRHRYHVFLQSLEHVSTLHFIVITLLSSLRDRIRLPSDDRIICMTFYLPIQRRFLILRVLNTTKLPMRCLCTHVNGRCEIHHLGFWSQYRISSRATLTNPCIFSSVLFVIYTSLYLLKRLLDNALTPILLMLLCFLIFHYQVSLVLRFTPSLHNITVKIILSGICFKTRQSLRNCV